MDHKLYYIERKSGEKKEEKIYFESALRFLYGSAFGRWVGRKIATLPFISKFFGWWQRLGLTKTKILPFISKYEVDLTEFELSPEKYTSFDAFFTRKLKNAARPIGQGVIAPADGRYLFYQNISTCNGFVVKGKKFSLEKLLGSDQLAKRYFTGSMIIIRLCPSDYHRFHFPVDCQPSAATLINGPLFSVNPIAVKQNIDLLTENKRMITKLESPTHGQILFLEIGATCVGSVHQTFTPGQFYKKGDEKGYFSFGGSSIILLFEHGKLHLAPDLIKNSEEQIETRCLFGDSLEF